MNCNKHDWKNCHGKSEAEHETNQISQDANMFDNGNHETVKIPVQLPESSYTVQFISIGIRPDNIYEAKMILAPDVDMSSVKITVKNKNLRVSVRKLLDNNLKQLLGKIDTNLLDNLIEKSIKHCENFLIPESINDGKVRAVMDNKHRLLIVTAPTEKFSDNTGKKVTDVERT